MPPSEDDEELVMRLEVRRSVFVSVLARRDAAFGDVRLVEAFTRSLKEGEPPPPPARHGSKRRRG